MASNVTDSHFDEYLECGRLETGFLGVQCEPCHDVKLVAFGCKRSGFCPSCGAHGTWLTVQPALVDEILPHQPMRQWVLSAPFPLRFLFASHPNVMGKVMLNAKSKPLLVSLYANDRWIMSLDKMGQSPQKLDLYESDVEPPE